MRYYFDDIDQKLFIKMMMCSYFKNIDMNLNTIFKNLIKLKSLLFFFKMVIILFSNLFDIRIISFHLKL